jgi:hypothetical protein
MISLFAWILALRGVVLMAAPDLYERAAMSMARYRWCGSSSEPSSRLGSISPMWVGSPSPLPHPQITTREGHDSEKAGWFSSAREYLPRAYQRALGGGRASTARTDPLLRTPLPRRLRAPETKTWIRGSSPRKTTFGRYLRF